MPSATEAPTGLATAPGPAAGGDVELLGLPLERLAAVLAPHLDRAFRAEQIYREVYERGQTSLAGMTALPSGLREALASRFRFTLPQIERLAEASDGTTKVLMRLADGASIEAVDIPTPRRRTLCLSSQAGCALACRFCVTGYWGAGRNLTAGEIVGQVLAIRQRIPSEAKGLNLVFMGMGEPLLNLGAVRDALAILTEQISWRRVTVSTAGVVPGIDAMAAWPERPNLAISLHAADEERRSAIMPINRTYPLADLLAALERYPLERNRRLTFEYVLIRGINDALRDADALARLVRRFPAAKVNLIPLNPDPVLGDLEPPEPAALDRFAGRLVERQVLVTVRRQRGDEVSGACGQLRAFAREARTWKGRGLAGHESA